VIGSLEERRGSQNLKPSDPGAAEIWRPLDLRSAPSLTLIGELVHPKKISMQSEDLKSTNIPAARMEIKKKHPPIRVKSDLVIGIPYYQRELS
jgi:hypothetical protein